MKLTGLMHVRNEECNIGLTARVALEWVDLLLVYAHACQDRTLDILDPLRRTSPLLIHINPDPVWNEMNHRQEMLDWARQLESTHIALIDADELLTANLLPSIRSLVESTPAGQALTLPGIQLWELDKQRIDGLFQPKFSLAFQDDPTWSWKPKNGYQHHNRLPGPGKPPAYNPPVEGGVFHLQFIRKRTLKAKQARYKMIELLRWPSLGVSVIDRRYSWWNTLTDPILRPVPASWWQEYKDRGWLSYLDLSDDKPSWFEADIHRLITQFGRDKFDGLDLFGIV